MIEVPTRAEHASSVFWHTKSAACNLCEGSAEGDIKLDRRLTNCKTWTQKSPRTTWAKQQKDWASQSQQ